jgi:hypothetical protein
MRGIGHTERAPSGAASGTSSSFLWVGAAVEGCPRQHNQQPSTHRAAASRAACLQFKVALLGAAGGIGQPLSMLMKLSPYISELSLYDVANTPGVAADVSHMSTGAAEGHACVR